MVKLLFNILLYLVEYLITILFITHNYEKKQTKFLHTVLIGAPFFLIGALLQYFVQNNIVNLISFFLITFLFFITCFKISFKDSILYSLILDAIMYSSELIAIYCASYILKIPTDSYQNNFYIFIILTIISKVIYFAISQGFAFLINKLKFKTNNQARFIPLFIFPILSIAMSFLFLRMSFVNRYSNIYNIAFMILNILMIAASLYIFIYYQILIKNNDKMNELQAEVRTAEIDQNYLEILRHQNDELHMLSHDTKNHFITLLNLETKKEMDNYIANVIGNTKKYDVIQRTNNKLLDLLLSKYNVLCKNNNIHFYIEVRTANLSYIPEVDLSVLINNLMDNALEAAKNSSERVIDFSIRNVNDFDVLNISNSCDHSPQHQGRRLITTKESKDLHGFGTRIIEKYAKKINAKYEWFYDKKAKRFNSTIIFNK